MQKIFDCVNSLGSKLFCFLIIDVEKSHCSTLQWDFPTSIYGLIIGIMQIVSHDEGSNFRYLWSCIILLTVICLFSR